MTATHDFVHLHVHSEYSLLDGCARIEAIPARAAELGMKAVALTDHGVLHGAVRFAQAAHRVGIKPIIGCEMYVVDTDQASTPRRGTHGAHHLTILAQDAVGYRNLSILSSLGFLEGFYYRPRVTKEQLATHREGLIILSGCLAAEVPRLLAQGQRDKAREVATWYLDLFGRDNYYLELTDHGLEDQRRVNAEIIGLSQELDLGVVATNDVHYLHQADAKVHDMLLCIQTGKRLDDPDRLRFESDQLYLKSAQEMARLFEGVEGALSNTVAIAERCSFNFEEKTSRLPRFPVAEGETSQSLLRRLVTDGLVARYSGRSLDEAQARAEYELNVIESMGFVDYFLIVWDLVAFARKAGIAVGPGRGSAASSIVAYALEVTDVDPLAHGLLFERFLNPERVTMPDIDIDFCFERRHEVLEYAATRFGSDRVAHIATFGTLAARAAVRDVGRVLGVPYAQVDRVAKLIPAGSDLTLEEALQTNEALRAAAADDPQVAELLDLSRRVEGIPRHLSVHAAGILIGPSALTPSTPLCKTSEGTVVTQYTGEDLETLGFLKLDLLGLRTLTVLSKACDHVAAHRGVHLDLRRIPLDDEHVYNTLKDGKTEGLFQLESGMFQSLIQEVAPKEFNDVVALLALGRPGPMARLQDYLRHRRNEAALKYPHEALKDILDETHGIMLYQEQVMRIATEVAGYTPGQADLLRRAMGKKLPEAMHKERERFIASARERGVDPSLATRLFDDIAHFAEYGFPKSHSTAYAMLSYQTAYLKTHYPQEFMAALLSSVMDSTDRLARYLAECRRLGLSISGPDVNISGVEFTVNGKGVRFGLAGIKHVGRAMAQEIVRVRQSAPFHSLEDFCRRMPSQSVSRKALESLLRVGAFDAMDITRKEGLRRIDHLLRTRSVYDEAQTTLFDEPKSTAPSAKNGEETILNDELSADERLRDEIELLGTYVTMDPLAPYYEVLSPYTAPEEGTPLPPESLVGGVAILVEEKLTRSGRPIAFVTIEDAAARRVQLLLFSDVYQNLDRLAPGRAILAKGRWEHDEVDAKLIVSQARMIEDTPVEVEVSDLEALHTLHRRLRPESGGRPLIVRLRSQGATARLLLPPRYWLQQASPFLDELGVPTNEE